MGLGQSQILALILQSVLSAASHSANYVVRRGMGLRGASSLIKQVIILLVILLQAIVCVCLQVQAVESEDNEEEKKAKAKERDEERRMEEFKVSYTCT